MTAGPGPGAEAPRPVPKETVRPEAGRAERPSHVPRWLQSINKAAKNLSPRRLIEKVGKAKGEQNSGIRSLAVEETPENLDRKVESVVKKRWGEGITPSRAGEDAVGFTKEQWSGVLEAKFNFSGDELQRATEYMYQLCQGVLDVKKYHLEQTQQGLEDTSSFRVPEIFFLQGQELGNYNLGAAVIKNSRGAILVSERYLRDIIQENPADETTYEFSDGAVAFKGSNAKQIYYAGVEEGDHQVFHYQGIKGTEVALTDLLGGELRQDKYDALAQEYRWLHVGASIAHTNGDTEIEEIYRTRISAADRYRESLSVSKSNTEG